MYPSGASLVVRVLLSLGFLLLTEMEQEDEGERLSEAFPIRVPLKLMRGTDLDATLGLLSGIVGKEVVIMPGLDL